MYNKPNFKIEEVVSMDKKGNGRIIAIVLLIAVILGIIGGSALMKKRKKLADAEKYRMRKTPVEVAKVVGGVLREEHRYMAVVEPIQTTNLSSRITALIEKIYHQEGENVKSGELLISLDDRQYRDGLASMDAQIEQAKSELESNQENIKTLEESLAYWKKELERNKNLRKSGSIAIAKVDATQERLNQVDGKLRSARKKSLSIKRKIDSLNRKADELRTTLSYCSIKAPFDGVITEKRVDVGDLASPGKVLMVVENRNILKLSFDVPQYDLPYIKVGMKVKYMEDGIEREGKISRLYPSLNRARMARVEANLSGSKLTLGAFIDVRVVFDKVDGGNIVPVSSIIELEDGKTKIFVVNGEKLVARDIEILGTTNSMASVRGVKEGEMVVKNSFLGWAKLHDGMKVEVLR